MTVGYSRTEDEPQARRNTTVANMPAVMTSRRVKAPNTLCAPDDCVVDEVVASLEPVLVELLRASSMEPVFRPDTTIPVPFEHVGALTVELVNCRSAH